MPYPSDGVSQWDRTVSWVLGPGAGIVESEDGTRSRGFLDKGKGGVLVSSNANMKMSVIKVLIFLSSKQTTLSSRAALVFLVSFQEGIRISSSYFN